ncbi:thiol:disulfide interchange protein DsbA/DsbL [Paraburkholderia dinghuensis]|uniref:Thiol:disulfide interchange protein n=1 Tax=Paraburkholderia dinghuensis TaxID=2305225 RepID=A0A3N6MLX6_9BURK|nr:thiol:disulfide interchange protein DsbA/DsbL [Paraburkholderia dinghuensis]RQH04709.1 thiol:disulfide interchange protein DsbA/DsbL [Paraburkholderia dinghuensis]
MKRLLGSLLLSLSMFVGIAHAAPAAPVSGKDYAVLATPQPVNVPAGKIEVIEFMWYGCPHCAEFDPLLEAWIKKQAPDVVFKRVPVAFRDDFIPHSKLFYAIDALGLSQKLTPVIFNEIHVNKNYLLTPEDQAKFLATQGVDPKKFMEAYNSFSVQSALQRDKEVATGFNISGVPTLAIQGKYETGPGQTNSLPRTIEVLDYLVSRVRAKQM